MTKERREALYDAVIAGIECGSYASFGVLTGEQWVDAWKRAERGEADAFAHATFFDRYDGDQELEKRLTDASLEEGLKILGRVAPGRAGEVRTGDSDALSGDALIQCALLGDVIYG